MSDRDERAVVKIRNYTSQVSAARSVMEIEGMLVEFGAANISKSYGKDAKLEAIVFEIKNPLNPEQLFSVKLPAHIEAMKDAIRGIHPGWYTNKISEQAERTAWRLMFEWTQIQLALISMKQAQPLEIFMPYIYDKQRKGTFFELASADHFKALPAPE